MKVKHNVKYFLDTWKIGVITYFSIILLVRIIAGIALKVTHVGAMNINGTEIHMLFVFAIVLLTSASDDFKFLIQNGSSRQSILKSQVITSIIISAFSALILVFIEGLSFGVGTDSLFIMIYNQTNPLTQFIWSFGITFAVLALSYLIVLIFLKLTKRQRLVVGIGIPLIFFLVIPILAIFFPKVALMMNVTFALKIISFMFGITETGLYPLNSFFALLTIAVLAILISYVLIKKIEVK